MSRRRLRPDEIELWRCVADRVERLHPEAAAKPPPLPRPKPVKPPVARIEPFALGQAARAKPGRHDLKPGLPDRLGANGLRMDRKVFARMKRGKLSPEARIDLHGRRLEDAHGALVRFVLSSQASGRRLVLVITGKGKSGPDDGPIPRPRDGRQSASAPKSRMPVLRPPSRYAKAAENAIRVTFIRTQIMA